MYGLLTKFVRSRWLDIGQVLFRVFMDRAEVEVHKHAKEERGQYTVLLYGSVSQGLGTTKFTNLIG